MSSVLSTAPQLPACACPPWCRVRHTTAEFIEVEGVWVHRRTFIDTEAAEVSVEFSQAHDGRTEGPYVFASQTCRELSPAAAHDLARALDAAAYLIEDTRVEVTR